MGFIWSQFYNSDKRRLTSMQISPISAFKAINFKGHSKDREPKIDYTDFNPECASYNFERAPEEDTFSRKDGGFLEKYRKTGHMAEAICGGDCDDYWDE